MLRLRLHSLRDDGHGGLMHAGSLQPLASAALSLKSSGGRRHRQGVDAAQEAGAAQPACTRACLHCAPPAELLYMCRLSTTMQCVRVTRQYSCSRRYQVPPCTASTWATLRPASKPPSPFPMSACSAQWQALSSLTTRPLGCLLTAPQKQGLQAPRPTLGPALHTRRWSPMSLVTQSPYTLHVALCPSSPPEPLPPPTSAHTPALSA